MSFDRLARHYGWMETVLAGSRLQRCRCTWLDALEGARDILIAGVGLGHFLRACHRRHPAARITSIDASPAMLGRARRLAEHDGARMTALRFEAATLPQWQPPRASFDVIVTHFFLDCFPPGELDAVVATLAGAARPRACWLLSDFAVPERGPARWRARAVHRLMYAFFRPVTGIRARQVTPPDPALTRHGFRLRDRNPSDWGLLRADLWVRPGT